MAGWLAWLADCLGWLALHIDPYLVLDRPLSIAMVPVWLASLAGGLAWPVGWSGTLAGLARLAWRIDPYLVLDRPLSIDPYVV